MLDSDMLCNSETINHSFHTKERWLHFLLFFHVCEMHDYRPINQKRMACIF